MSSWEKYDPDMILSYSESELENFAKSRFKCNTIFPREDMIQYIHKESGCIVDMGFYGDIDSNDGIWKVVVIGSDQDWENPIKVYNFIGIVDVVKQTKELINEFST